MEAVRTMPGWDGTQTLEAYLAEANSAPPAYAEAAPAYTASTEPEKTGQKSEL